ncbi:hypothetical protein GCM10007932_07760 [Vibrio penaeicida]|uniref:Uncharacterized protein n=1 Tax=Vibrio penaeicida TaxID=104609 RepID=A0AAV5NN10_9VIBR|nr:hypothetical protein GCM10007932_07760 [Vibrio penaeicida]
MPGIPLHTHLLTKDRVRYTLTNDIPNIIGPKDRMIYEDRFKDTHKILLLHSLWLNICLY